MIEPGREGGHHCQGAKLLEALAKAAGKTRQRRIIGAQGIG